VISYPYAHSLPVQFLLKCSKIEDAIRRKGFTPVTSCDKTLITGYASCLKEHARDAVSYGCPAGMEEAIFQIVGAAVCKEKIPKE